jgi:hypothetical protein
MALVYTLTRSDEEEMTELKKGHDTLHLSRAIHARIRQVNSGDNLAAFLLLNECVKGMTSNSNDQVTTEIDA